MSAVQLPSAILRKSQVRGSVSLPVLAAALVAGFAGPALAQDDAVNLGTVKIEDRSNAFKQDTSSSPKSTAPLRDTPQTVVVIPEAVYTQQGAQNLTEVLRNTPGITFNAGENGFASGTSNFSMRGVDTTGSIYMDGVRDSGNYNRDVFNIERVEVVKGAAADNGRGGAGGYVNMVTKTPHQEASYSGIASYGFDEYGSKDRGRASLDLNHPLTDTSAIRLNLMMQGGGVAGREVAKKESYGIAPSLALGLGKPTRFVLAYQHLKIDDTPDWGPPAALIDGIITFDPTLDAKSLRDKFYGLASDFDDVRSDSVLARVEHDFSSNLMLSNQLRYSDTERATYYTLVSGYTPATRLVATQRQAYQRDNQSFTNQTNLLATFDTGSLSHTLSAGIEFSNERSAAGRFGTQNNPGTGAAISIFNPNANRAGAWVTAPLETAKVKINTIAGYVYDTVVINPEWQVTGGVRVEDYRVTIESKTAAGAPQGPDGYKTAKTTVSGKIGAVYKPVEEASIYASVGWSAQPPASYLSNPDISRQGDNAFPGFSVGLNAANAKVQRSTNYEVGGKWDLFDNSLSATIAFFHTVRSNVAISGIDPNINPAPPVTLLGYGEQVIQGIELGLAGNITPEWAVFGGMLYMDSERQHSAFLDAGRRRANPADYGAALRTNGDELAFTPNFSANFWTTYRLPMGLTLGGGVQYVGDSWVGRPDDAERIILNGNVGKLPSYFVLNAMIEYEVSEQVSLRLNVDNLSDELYAVSTNWPAARVLLGPSRSFLLSVQAKL